MSSHSVINAGSSTPNEARTTINANALEAALNKQDKSPSNHGMMRSVSTQSGSDFFDSGYASSEITPLTTRSTNKATSTDLIVAPPRRFHRPKVLKKFPFKVPDNHYERYKDLRELFDRPLSKHLLEHGVPPSSISIVPLMLGEAAATAKPWIVVFCNKSHTTVIRRWFNVSSIKSSYRGSDNPQLPSFDLLVCDQPPQTLGTSFRNVYGKKWDGLAEAEPTLCGRSVRVQDGIKGRNARIGGVLKIAWADGHWSLFCVTVEHVFDYGREDSPRSDSSNWTSASPEEEEEEEYTLSLHYQDEATEDIAGEEESIAVFSEAPSILETVHDINDAEWANVGSMVSEPRSHARPNENDLDWVLFKLDDARKYRRNLYKQQNTFEPMQLPSSSPWPGLGKSVLVVTGTGPTIKGTIQQEPVLFSLPPNNGFMETYYLVLGDSSGLQRGDSGAWVIDEDSGEVYGQVVASDIVGNVYVIPLDAILDQIKSRCRCKSVSFPTVQEIDEHILSFIKPKISIPTISIPVANEKPTILDDGDYDTLRRLFNELKNNDTKPSKGKKASLMKTPLYNNDSGFLSPSPVSSSSSRLTPLSFIKNARTIYRWWSPSLAYQLKQCSPSTTTGVTADSMIRFR